MLNNNKNPQLYDTLFDIIRRIAIAAGGALLAYGVTMALGKGDYHTGDYAFPAAWGGGILGFFIPPFPRDN